MGGWAGGLIESFGVAGFFFHMRKEGYIGKGGCGLGGWVGGWVGGKKKKGTNGFCGKRSGWVGGWFVLYVWFCFFWLSFVFCYLFFVPPPSSSSSSSSSAFIHIQRKRERAPLHTVNPPPTHPPTHPPSLSY